MTEPAEPLMAADAMAHNRRRLSTSKHSTADTTRLRPQNQTADGAGVDPDTCRICRGEGTDDEPLFYPCKCSGSIKYVHQDCLMEWLSHSQKKHCELCKTSFRFTKLYSPKMPSTIPVHVFVGHMAKYLFRNILVWLRAALVVFVWLCWLPWLMRSIWSFLFWLSNEGIGARIWGPDWNFRPHTPRNSAAAAWSQSPHLLNTCPAHPFVDPSVYSASGHGMEQQLAEMMRLQPSSTFSATWHGVNISTNDSFSAAFLRAIFGFASSSTPDLNGVCPVDRMHVPVDHGSLLSDVSFLRNLTSSPLVNRTIITILEGQFITVLVVVCFILVILVRDYVVQQQPEINMRAALNENPQAQAEPQIQPQPLPRRQHQDPALQRMAEEVEDLPGPDDDDEEDEGDVGGLDSQNSQLDTIVERGLGEAAWEDDASQPDRSRHSDIEEEVSQASPATAASIQPGLSNRPSPNQHALGAPPRDQAHSPVATVHEYLRIYRQANGDPERILQIIQDENLEETLGYWARVTRSMIDKNKEAAHSNGPTASTGEEAESSQRPAPQQESWPVPLPPPSAPDFSWPSKDEHENGEAEFDVKGRGKEVERDEMHADGQPESGLGPSTSSYNFLRPRAASDGPQRFDTINPLANNSWSFAGIPSDDTRPGASNDRDAPTSQPQATTVAGSSRPVNSYREDLPPPRDGDGTDDADDSSQHSGASRSVASGTQRSDVEPFGPLPEHELAGMAPEAAAGQTGPGDLIAVEAAPAQQRPPLQRGVMDRLADFMWRDVEPRERNGAADRIEDLEDIDTDTEDDLDHEHGGGDGEDDDDDQHEDDGDFLEEGPDLDDGDQRDPEVVQAAVAAGLDPEAIDDAEDMEGVLELVGMRGPLVGLFQNAVFCAVLVSVTIFLCVFLPYNFGRVSVWALMNPMRLVRMLFSFTKFVQDLAVALVSGACSGFLTLVVYVGNALGLWLPSARRSCVALRVHTWDISSNATVRVFESLAGDLPLISATEIQNFSAVSHQALLDLKSSVSTVLRSVGTALEMLFDGELPAHVVRLVRWATEAASTASHTLRNVPLKLLNPASWVISFGISEPAASIDPALASWSGTDRFWAILCGYLSLSGLGALYLRRGTPFSSGQVAQEWEASLIDLLNQASGVMKVILIISIEMLVFPLYCGLLLDAALLPLFEEATIRSRIAFMANYPLTSIFVHWFVGTGYMFHFALFVSMCRKIMRKGVLYFIRDPDDPEFHPVRDVLERNVVTQLRKILFSAFVYGALVVVCLGGVVWSLSFSLKRVLPIHYSSNEPVLEFPIDLLFYNFAMPLAVKFFRPSNKLHAMYTWWLRKCARGLRLSWFLFGERRIDEEGVLALRSDSPHLELPWWRRYFLEVNRRNRVVPQTWQGLIEGGTSKPGAKLSKDKMIRATLEKRMLVQTGQLIKDGRFVRTPASDQVKIPKGNLIFVEVTEYNERLDGKADLPGTDLYSTDQYQLVYLPPNFRFRIFLFILYIWLFAAVTGVSFTIIPLVFGRAVFEQLIPAHIRTNDIYAFSMGIYILGSIVYLCFHARSIAARVGRWAAEARNTVWDRATLRHVSSVALRVAKVVYAYSMLLIVFPLILTSLMELYVILPLHTYVDPPSPYVAPTGGTTASGLATGAVVPSQHTARAVQSWTLGLLYVKLGARAITSFYDGTRPAAAVRAILRGGWLHPDVSVLTRAFVLPGLFLAAVALFGPAYVTSLLESRGWLGHPAPAPHELVTMYRLSYPAAALAALAVGVLWSVVGVLRSWQIRIRDEAYLIGERLHNFGVGAAEAAAAGARGGQWRMR
ncbi:hypothetical protein ACRALDRAFT_1083479 [Sodiomyces alcalophilus JCM 7366]|uniref:uncharacterized protein n=1 Tax=Sodiomyces alcalophilus JCM 7366 TaxID=591952 RepID=UPI0039B37BF0